MYTITAINGAATDIIHENDPDSLVRLSAGKFSDEVNAIPCFQFDIPASNPKYNELHDRTTIISVHNDKTGEIDFEGPLIHSVENVTAAGKVYKSCSCEGYLTYLNDSIQQYHNYTNTDVQGFIDALLTYHNSVTPEKKHITRGECITGDNTNSKTTSYRNTLEEIKVNLIERIGGEIRIRKDNNGNLKLDFLSSIGTTSETTIELAKNIYSINVDTDTSNIVTRLVPLGAQVNDETSERLTISSVNSGLPYIDDATGISRYGVIMGTVIFDDITVASNLLQRGQEYLTNNNRVKKGYVAQVLDLSLIETHSDYSNFTIKAGNTYRFKHSVIGLDEDLRVMKCTIDIFKPYKPEVQIGDKAESITTIATHTASLIEYELPKQRSDIIQAATARTTAMLNSATKGYIYIDNDNGELLIMDAPNKIDARKIWRWNSGGFAYSSQGYNEGYFVGLTADGGIIADYITSGTLTGLAINNGNGTFYVDSNGNVTAASINITGGSIHITTNSESYDVIEFSCTDWVSKLSPLELRLVNNDIHNCILIQAGGLYGYKNYSNGSGTQTLLLFPETGRIYCTRIDGTTVVSDDLFYKDSNSGTYKNVQTMIDDLQRQINAL